MFPTTVKFAGLELPEVLISLTKVTVVPFVFQSSTPFDPSSAVKKTSVPMATNSEGLDNPLSIFVKPPEVKLDLYNLLPVASVAA